MQSNSLLQRSVSSFPMFLSIRLRRSFTLGPLHAVSSSSHTGSLLSKLCATCERPVKRVNLQVIPFLHLIIRLVRTRGLLQSTPVHTMFCTFVSILAFINSAFAKLRFFFSLSGCFVVAVVVGRLARLSLFYCAGAPWGQLMTHPLRQMILAVVTDNQTIDINMAHMQMATSLRGPNRMICNK